MTSYNPEATIEPPSTNKTVPVTQSDAEEAKNSAAPTTSSGNPIRPSGVTRSW